ncbi:hypothetical protein Q1695_012437 [Nippostrongylus brasiliensis]|nr:hypothetical protein Q1695_012437 [Nippostrongylus brasiliensis]
MLTISPGPPRTSTNCIPVSRINGTVNSADFIVVVHHQCVLHQHSMCNHSQLHVTWNGAKNGAGRPLIPSHSALFMQCWRSHCREFLDSELYDMMISVLLYCLPGHHSDDAGKIGTPFHSKLRLVSIWASRDAKLLEAKLHDNMVAVVRNTRQLS